MTIPVVATGPYPSDRQFLQIGNGDAVFAAMPGATNIFDIRIDDSMVEPNSRDVYLFGGEFWTDANVQASDYLEFSVVDKDDVLGLFALYGLTPGIDVIELAKYVRKRPIIASENGKVLPGQATLVMEGLYLRNIYVAAAPGVTRDLRVIYYMAK